MFNSLKGDIRAIEANLKNDLRAMAGNFKSDMGAMESNLKNDINNSMIHLEKLFDSKLEAKIKPIEIALNNHITDTDKKIDALDAKVSKLEVGQRLILEKLEKMSG